MNVFLTVGTQLPFDRLARALDEWCAPDGAGAEATVFGQLGHLGADNYRPVHYPWVEWTNPATFADRVAWADLLVGHAGMGTIITALTTGTPAVLLARKAARKEHRNDHQAATAAHFGTREGLHIATTEDDLPRAIAEALRADREGDRLGSYAEPALIATVRDFIHLS